MSTGTGRVGGAGVQSDGSAFLTTDTNFTLGLATGGTPAPLSNTVTFFSSSPAAGATGVAQDATIIIRLDSPDTVDPLTVDAVIQGRQAIIAGIFQTGWAGTILQDGTQVVITITTHPVFDDNPVLFYIQAEDGGGDIGDITFSFTAAIPEISSLVAKSDCEGKRIDLSWTNPAGVIQMRIVRSTFAYSNFEVDPGDIVYEGVAIAALSDTGLEENRFYYYTIFISFTAATPFTFVVFDSGKVEGLAIRDYATLHLNAGIPEGRYVYALMPRTYRQRDAEAARGDDQFLLRDYCDMLQCGINMYRGWADSLVSLKDPDNAPVGRLGEAENQFGIMSAYVQDMGITPERSFDAGVLRRLVIGITGVHKKKGTCQGLIDLTKILTTWDSRCDEAIVPICGINRLFTIADGVSYFRFGRGVTHDPNISNGTVIIDSTTLGEIRVKKTHFWDPPMAPVGFAPTNLTPNSLHLISSAGVLDATGFTPDDGDLVDTWEDQSAAGNDAVQPSNLDRYFYEVPGTSQFELRVGLDNQVTSFMTIQGPGGTNFISGQSAAFFFAVDVETTVGESILLSIETGPLVCKARIGVADEYGFEDATGEVSFSVARRFGPQALVYVFDADASMAHLYIDGVLEASVAYTAPATLADDRVTLGDNAGAPGDFFNSTFGEVFALDRVPTPQELDLFWNYFATRYGAPGLYGPPGGEATKVMRPFGAVGTVPLTASGEITVVSCLSSLGDFACIIGVTDDGDEFIFEFEDDTAFIRAEIKGTGAIRSGVTYKITAIDTTSYPWQFLTPEVEPTFEKNALAGKAIIFDSPLALRTIVSNLATDSDGETLLTLDVSATGTTFAIADEYLTSAAFATRTPAVRVDFLVGEHSFLAELLWDLRLLRETEKGPWSLLPGLGSAVTGLGFAPSPSDVTVFVENQDEIVGTIDTVGTSNLQDTSQVWFENMWAGFFLLPNWNQTKLYRITGNSTDELFTVVTGAGMDTTAQEGSTYVILSPDNARKYRRLSNLLTNFIPQDSRGFVKFEEVEANFLAGLISTPDPTGELIGWYRSDKGIAEDGAGAFLQWADLSGKGHDLVVPTGETGPTFNALGGVQNLPYLDYAGAEVLEAPDTADLDLDELTMVVIYSDLGAASTSRILSKGEAAGSFNWGFRTVAGALRAETTTASTDDGTAPTGATAAIVSLHQRSIATVGIEQNFRVNGVAQAAPGTLGSQVQNTFPLTVGALRSAGPTYGDFLTARIYEIMIFNGILPTFLHERIERYKTSRYG